MADQPYTEADVERIAQAMRDAEVEIIYGSRDRNGHVQSTGSGPIGLSIARSSLHPLFVELVVQERRLWPDGAQFSSPWRTFQDQGSTDE